MNYQSYRAGTEGLGAMRDALLSQQMRKKSDEQQNFENQMRQAMVELQKRSTDASIADAERDFGFRKERAGVDDTRYADQRDYSRGRDTVGDQRYTDQTNYTRGRDTVGDQRYTDQRDYTRGRDTMGDQRYDTERQHRTVRELVEDNFKNMEMGLRQKQIDAGRRGSVRITGDEGETYTLPITDDQLATMQGKLAPGGGQQAVAPAYKTTKELLSAVQAGKITKEEAKAYAKKQGWN